MRMKTNVDLYPQYLTLRDYLLRQTRWTKQSDITAATGLNGVTTRQICNAYPCLALGSTKGYRAARNATPADIQHAVSTLTSRSIKMLERANRLSHLLVR